MLMLGLTGDQLAGLYDLHDSFLGKDGSAGMCYQPLDSVGSTAMYSERFVHTFTVLSQIGSEGVVAFHDVALRVLEALER